MLLWPPRVLPPLVVEPILFPAFRELEFLALCLSLITSFRGGICVAQQRGMSRSFEVTVKVDHLFKGLMIGVTRIFTGPRTRRPRI